jgi:hypothetical protein
LSGLLSDGFCEGWRVIDVARNRDRKRDDSEEKKKAQREAEERDIPVGINAIDVHGDASVLLPAAQDNRDQRGMFLGSAIQLSLSSS